MSWYCAVSVTIAVELDVTAEKGDMAARILVNAVGWAPQTSREQSAGEGNGYVVGASLMRNPPTNSKLNTRSVTEKAGIQHAVIRRSHDRRRVRAAELRIVFGEIKVRDP